MAQPGPRSVHLHREGPGAYVATTTTGATLRFGPGVEGGFSPVQLLLVAIAGCSALDLEAVTARRAEPLDFNVLSEALVIDDGGSRLDDLKVTFDVTFPEGEEGDKARERIEPTLRASHDRTCTVGRTVQAGPDITLVTGPVGAPATA